MNGTSAGKPTVVLFGVFDRDDLRARPVASALKQLGWRVESGHVEHSTETACKSELLSCRGFLRTIGRVVALYPRLMIRAWRHRPFQFVLVSIGGYPDVVFAWIVARAAGARLIFDPLYGLWETVVEDRQLVSPRMPLAWIVRRFERLCFRLSDRVIVDTQQHLEYFASRLRYPPERMIVVPVGAEDDLFRPPSGDRPTVQNGLTRVLFYGSMIPLHGADTIVRAARLIEDPSVQFTLVGQGQTSSQIERLAQELRCPNIRFVPRMPYAEVPQLIQNADICLGIFGTTQKTQYVVPTKVFQCAAMGKPVITGDTPAVRQLFRPGEHLLTVPCGQPQALAEVIMRLKNDPTTRRALGASARAWYLERFSLKALAELLRPLEAIARP